MAGVVGLLLCLDVGNTHISAGLFQDEAVLFHWRLPTEQETTADLLAMRLYGLFTYHGLAFSHLHGVAVCSVVPPLDHALADLCKQYLHKTPLWVTASTDTSVEILYDNPQEVGPDRIVNAAAAYAQCRGPSIVVDFGTATTLDAISAHGQYLGGAIAPGVGISVDALFRRAAMLPRIDLARPGRAIGRNTAASMQSGIVFGYAGQVDALVERMRQEMDGDPTVIATGGLAPLIAPECRTVQTIDPLLTLTGLRLIFRRHRPG